MISRLFQRAKQACIACESVRDSTHLLPVLEFPECLPDLFHLTLSLRCLDRVDALLCCGVVAFLRLHSSVSEDDLGRRDEVLVERSRFGRCGCIVPDERADALPWWIASPVESCS